MPDKLAEFENLLKDKLSVAPDHLNQEEIESSLVKLKESFIQVLNDNTRMSRTFSALRATINMPDLILDKDWNILGYSDNFVFLHDNIEEYAEKRRNLRGFLKKGDFGKIQSYLKSIEQLRKLPYGKGKRWQLRYKGPNAGDLIDKTWISYSSCKNEHWQIAGEDGNWKIMHRPCLEDTKDSFLIYQDKLGGLETDIKVCCKIKTSSKEEEVRDLSVVLSGAAGKEFPYSDFIGYTACVGANFNKEGGIRRHDTYIATVPEVLAVDTEYSLMFERTGGQLIRRLKNMETGREMTPLEVIDTNIEDPAKNYVGFGACSAAVEIYDIEIYTRESKLSIEQFNIPFDVEVGINNEKLDGRVFKLKLGTNFPGDRALNILLFEDITESKKAEESLRFERSQLLSIFDSIDEIVYVLDPRSYKILYANRFMREFLGRDPVGRFCYEVVKNLDRPCDFCGNENILKHKNLPVRLEIYNPALERYYNITERIIKWPDERDVRLQIATDITSHKRAEEALIKTNTLLDKTLKSLDEGVFLVDPDNHKIIDCNLTFEKLFGYKRDEAVVQSLEILHVSRELYDSFIRRLYAALDKNGVFHTEYRMKRKNGEVFISDLTITEICDDSGARSALVGVIRDITERKKAEEAVKESEEKYRSLFDNMVSAFSYHKILFDADNNPVGSVILEVNDAWEKIIGLKRQAVIGKSVKDLCTDIVDRDFDWDGVVRKVVLNGEKIKFDYYNQSRDQWFSYSCYSPKKGSLAVIFEDITERKKAQSDLERSQEQLRNLTAYLREVREEERTRISREIHDELGQLLTALKIDLSLLGSKLKKDQDPLKEQVKSMSNSIETAVETVQRIARDLRPGLLDELGLVAAIEWETEKFGERTGIACKVSLELEDHGLDRNFSTNVFRIFQEALTNVVRHAGASELKIGLKEVDNELIFQVVDNGRGIPVEKIWDSHSFGLMGIRERARFLGGKAEISCIRNKGTSVIVAIPIMRH
ncbi:MAG: PAS domain S-box protein [Acidobacteria bacterium]|nr:PAS domain S-box protein [Acidobacteriota bacterium]